MRLIALVVFVVLAGAAALAGQTLWQVWQAPLPRAVVVAPQGSGSPLVAVARRTPPPRWPALFGEVAVVEPQPPEPEPEPEPQPPTPSAPPQPPAPPLSSLGYQLKGLISDGNGRWALVSHPAGEQILRVGDALNEDYTIVEINADGLWVETAPGGPRSLLGFVN